MIDDALIELPAADAPTLVLPSLRRRLPVSRNALVDFCQDLAQPAGSVAETGEGDAVLRDILAARSQRADLAKAIHGAADAACRMSLVERATLKLAQIGRATLHPSNSPPPRFARAVETVAVQSLPDPVMPPGVLLWDTLLARASYRDGPLRTISGGCLSALLRYTLRTDAIADREFGELSYRPVASGGARHPIDLYVVPLRVSEVSPAVYQYDPIEHRLNRLRDRTAHVAEQLTKFALAGTGAIPSPLPAVSLFLTAFPARTACKYRDNVLSLIFQDAGCVIQQLYIVVQGLGLRGCAIGLTDPDAVEAALALQDGEAYVVGAFAVW